MNPEEKKFMEDLTKFKTKLSIPRQGELTSDEALAVVSQYSKDIGLDYNEARALIACFLQGGATAKGADGNMTFDYDGKAYKLADLRNSLKKCGRRNQMRKFARVLAQDIYDIAVMLDLDGNLYKKIYRMVASANEVTVNADLDYVEAHRHWLSDFQESNLNAPQSVRQLITLSYSYKARQNRQAPPNKPKKRTGK